jgi:hypothetical protein
MLNRRGPGNIQAKVDIQAQKHVNIQAKAMIQMQPLADLIN